MPKENSLTAYGQRLQGLQRFVEDYFPKAQKRANEILEQNPNNPDLVKALNDVVLNGHSDFTKSHFNTVSGN